MEALPRSPLFLAIFSALVIAEALWRWRTGRSYDAGAAFASFGVAIGYIIAKALTGGLVAFVFFAIYRATPLRLALDDWRTWLAAFVAVEFVYYWFHRMSHGVRWLWASHAVHHSADELTLPAAVRLGWTSTLSGGWLLFAPLVALGFHPLLIVALLGFNLVYQLFLHTEAVGKLGPLELALNTPSHHRVHHASNGDYLDKNFGGVLIVFDRMFGTFAEERAEEPPRYGLVKPLRSQNPFVIAFHEWARMARDAAKARSWRAFASALVGRPR